MKTTSSQKTQIINMIKEGINLDEIAKMFNISKSSVKRLKYSSVKRNDERIICEYCRGSFKQLTDKHLSKHNLTVEEYRTAYPNSPTLTSATTKAHRSFKSKNKGKTFEQIYGKKEGAIKREKISEKQVGRPAPAQAGTGLSGTRKDTMTYARSTYEANIDRIFKFENKNYADEFSELNPRVTFSDNGKAISYQPDRVDLDGLFKTGATIEVKGYMSPEDWNKICLFRKHHPSKNLIVISPDKTYADILYNELQAKYKPVIPLWETSSFNIKTHPELYQINYIYEDRLNFISTNYTDNISNSINDSHERFISTKCISYGAVSKGLDVLINSLKLQCITDKNKGALRKSSGEFNYEKWLVNAEERISGKKLNFYVTNICKTTAFCCHDENWETEFFEDNIDMVLKPGRKIAKNHKNIDERLWLSSDEKTQKILQMISDRLKHKAINEAVVDVKIIYSKKTKSKQSTNDREQWRVITDNGNCYFLDNFKKSTENFVLRFTEA